VHVHVDEAGRDDKASGIENNGAGALEAAADGLYVAIFDQHVRRPVQAGSRVDHASVLNEQRGHAV
jgi:hypothetical protein